MGFWSILGPKTFPKPFKTRALNFLGELLEGVLVPLGPKMGQVAPKPLKITLVNFLGEPFEGVLVPLGAKMGQDGPQTPPKTYFYGFWTPTC